MRFRTRILIALIWIATAASSAFPSELGDRLDRELKGGWAVLEVEVHSACGGTYSNNEVGSAGVASKAPHHFAAGELVKIDNVKVKRQRVDLMVTLAAPLRLSRMDGPFELYDQRRCQVQLMVFVPRELVKSANVEGLLAEVRRYITLYSSHDEAQMSDDWNGREVEPLPNDYEETLQRHAAWKAERTNAAVRDGIDHALSEASEVADDIDDNDDYLAGFGAGAEEMSDFAVTSCGSLLSASLTTYRKNPPSDQTRSFKDGWDDGQKLVFHVLLADRLRSCLVPVPAITAP
jgi:hypothetical protein